MKETFFHLTADMLFLGTVACVFFGATLVWYVALMKGREHFHRYQDTFTSTAHSTMGDMFLFVDPNLLFRYNLGAVVIIPMILLVLSRDFVVAFVAFLILLLLPTSIWRSLRAKRLRRIESQLPDALALVSGSLRAGASLGIALEALVKEQPPPISQEFELFLNEQRLGVDFELSLGNMEKRIPLQDFSMLVTALRINREVGGNLAETMESLGETLRRKAMMEGKIKSLTAQGRLQGIVMAGLPMLLALLLNFLEPDAMRMLWTTPIGWGVLTVVLFMEGLGFLMIRKITSIDV